MERVTAERVPRLFCTADGTVIRPAVMRPGVSAAVSGRQWWRRRSSVKSAKSRRDGGDERRGSAERAENEPEASGKRAGNERPMSGR